MKKLIRIKGPSVASGKIPSYPIMLGEIIKLCPKGVYDSYDLICNHHFDFTRSIFLWALVGKVQCFFILKL
jgi:hypothetical protein